MPDISCRKCGYELEIRETCRDCNSPISFFCPDCLFEPDKWIHSLCTNFKHKEMAIAA